MGFICPHGSHSKYPPRWTRQPALEHLPAGSQATPSTSPPRISCHAAPATMPTGGAFESRPRSPPRTARRSPAESAEQGVGDHPFTPPLCCQARLLGSNVLRIRVALPVLPRARSLSPSRGLRVPSQGSCHPLNRWSACRHVTTLSRHPGLPPPLAWRILLLPCPGAPQRVSCQHSPSYVPV